MVAESKAIVSPNDTQAILKKDAVYNAVGLCAFDIYDEVSKNIYFFIYIITKTNKLKLFYSREVTTYFKYLL